MWRPFLIVTTGRGGATGMQWGRGQRCSKYCKYTGQHPPQRIIWLEMSVVLRLRNPSLLSSQLLEDPFWKTVKSGPSSVKNSAKVLRVTYSKIKVSTTTYGPCMIWLPISSVTLSSTSLCRAYSGPEAGSTSALQPASSLGISDFPYSVFCFLFFVAIITFQHYKIYFIMYVVYSLSLEHKLHQCTQASKSVLAYRKPE